MSTAVKVCPHTELPLGRGSGDRQQQGSDIPDFSTPPSESAAGALVCSKGLPPQIHFHPFGPRERECRNGPAGRMLLEGEGYEGRVQ